MSDWTPLTPQEIYQKSLDEAQGEPLVPETRLEYFLNKIAEGVGTSEDTGLEDFSIITLTLNVTGDVGNTLHISILGFDLNGGAFTTALIKDSDDNNYYSDIAYDEEVGSPVVYNIVKIGEEPFTVYLNEGEVEPTSVTGDCEVESGDTGYFVTITGDCTITAEGVSPK